jgi:hypothetical protein
MCIKYNISCTHCVPAANSDSADESVKLFCCPLFCAIGEYPVMLRRFVKLLAYVASDLQVITNAYLGSPSHTPSGFNNKPRFGGWTHYHSSWCSASKCALDAAFKNIESTLTGFRISGLDQRIMCSSFPVPFLQRVCSVSFKPSSGLHGIKCWPGSSGMLGASSLPSSNLLE